MSDLKLYRAKLKTRARIMREIPREQQGWWADVCAGKTLELRDAAEADLDRCNLGPAAPRDPADYLCENIERGSLVRRIAVAELTEITPRGLVAQHNETIALRARIKELEAELARRTQPEATAPAQDQQLVVATSTETGFFHVVISLNDGKRTLVLYDKQHSLNGDTVGVADVPAAALAYSANSLSAGDRVDAERYRAIRNRSPSELVITNLIGLRREDLDVKIDAILQSQKDNHG